MNTQRRPARIPGPLGALRRASIVELLEPRQFLSAAAPASAPVPPHISGCFADNRGKVVLRVDQDLVPATVTASAASLRTAGADGVLGTGDDVAQPLKVRYRFAERQILLRAELPADTPYLLVARAGRLRAAGSGLALDGEFTSTRTPSGDGTPGGNYRIIASPAASASPLVRFSTSFGDISIRLNAQANEQALSTFLRYVNTASFDGTILHRLAPQGSSLQGGGFRLGNASNTLQPLIPSGDAPLPERTEQDLPNTAGTLSLLTAATPAGTTQFRFNLADAPASSALPIGQVTDPAALATLRSVASGGAVDARRQFGDGFRRTPVTDASVIQSRGGAVLFRDLLRIWRVAVRMAVRAVS